MANANQKAEVVVFGGGPGGYAAAFEAADLGLDVTLIDLDKNPGGTCLYRGCIPSKALLHVARVLKEAEEAVYYGIHFGAPTIDIDQMRSATNGVVEKLTGGLGQLVKARKITYIQGRASFTDAQTLRIDKTDGSQATLRFKHCILAAGSRQLPDIPKTMLVIGGGYIGLELGSVYAALGTKVTLVEMTGTLLPGCDADLVKPLHDRIKGQLEAIYLNSKVESMKETKAGISVKMSGEVDRDEQTFDKVLIAVGRKPNSSGIGLETTRIEVDDKGFVKVDEQRRTTDPNIFAIGDIAGQPMLAHKASHEGRVAAEVIAGRNAAFEPRGIPAVVFTDPEVAWVGLTETEAVAREIDVKIARFPWGASGRAATLNRPEGMTKVIADPKTDAVLGIGIVGTNAGELIAEGALALEMGALASDVQFTIHAHPTLGETIMESAEMIFGSSTHFHRK
jgi:dihydrolipoamide dehydrogenase